MSNEEKFYKICLNIVCYCPIACIAYGKIVSFKIDTTYYSIHYYPDQKVIGIAEKGDFLFHYRYALDNLYDIDDLINFIREAFGEDSSLLKGIE